MMPNDSYGVDVNLIHMGVLQIVSSQLAKHALERGLEW